VHAKGLKLGIYSSPGPQTCQQLPGSYHHEAQDAALYARWGMDMLKYDLCSGRARMKDPDDPREMRSVYARMGDPLLRGPRDILFSLCEYGLAKVEQWGPEVGGNLWRTTGDIRDSWEGISEIGFSQNGREKWAGPGHWNDPDMLVVGAVGWGVELHQSRLSPSEQMTHIGLWSLLAAPMFLGCDLSQLDPFTARLLTNDEVLDVNQDPLGRQAARKSQSGLLEVWAKQLEDGTMAVGLFNRGIEPAKVTAEWADIGVAGRQPVRDLWQRKNLGDFDSAFTAAVAPHGMSLIKVGRAKK
jgi:alpha-galactosidase